MPTTPTPVELFTGDLPTPSDRTSYGTRGRAVWEWEMQKAIPGVNLLASQTFDNAEDAAASAGTAAALRDDKGNWSSLTGALNRPASCTHNGFVWILVQDVTNVTLYEPGVSLAWAQYQSAGTAEDISFDPTGTPIEGTTVQDAIEELSPILSTAYGNRNVLINGSFVVNQRAVTGTVVLSAGQYGHDRWKAGSGGCTYTFATSGGVTTLTITAGSLIQVIEGANLQTGTYFLSWEGTAQGRIAAGAYSASGVSASVTGGANLNIEFNTGTLRKAQFEAQRVTPFEFRVVTIEKQLCSRYFWRERVFDGLNFSTYTSAYVSWQVSFPVEMRATPTLTYNVSGTAVSGVTSHTFDSATRTHGRYILLSSGAGVNHTIAFGAASYFQADAEL